VGILWQTGHINAAQEHIASNILRQKIVSAIDALPPVQRQQPLFLLLLPEDEHHELGLLFVNYLLKKQGYPVLYLGADVPLDDTRYVTYQKDPAFLYLHLTSFPSRLQLEKYLLNLSSAAPNASILISGSVVAEYKKTVPSNVKFLHSLEEVVEMVNGEGQWAISNKQ
jgi:MerR family transcriptional regulator, light-induced transcriptional regulator